MKSSAIKAFGLALDPSQCRLYVDEDLEDAPIPCMSYRSLFFLFLTECLIDSIHISIRSSDCRYD